MSLSQYDLLALMPCPLKVPFEKLILTYLNEQKKQGVFLNCNIDANVNNHEALPNKEVFNLIKQAEDIRELPEILFTTGLNYLYFSEFREKFIGKEYFEDVSDGNHKRFDVINYRDPEGEYTMVTINPLVLVVNLEKIGKRDVPSDWGCLVEDTFKNEIVIRGNDHMYCETVLLYLYKYYGKDNLSKFKENLKEGLHPAQMVKVLMGNLKKAKTIYVMPYFFAQQLHKKKQVKIVWPDAGALANPVSMLVKKEANNNVKALAKYILNSEVGQLFEDVAFPSVNNEIQKDKMLENVDWIGWDAIENPHIGAVVDGLNKYYLGGGTLDEIKNIF